MQNDAAVNPTQEVPFTGADEVFGNTVWFSCKGEQKWVLYAIYQIMIFKMVLHTLRALICCKMFLWLPNQLY